MTELLPILTTIGLLDAVSIVSLAVVPLLAALGSERPGASAWSLLAGLFVPYYAFGLLLTLGLSGLFDTLTERFDRWLYAPDSLDMLLQGLIGVISLSFGFKLANSRTNQDDRGAGDTVAPSGAFGIGFALTIVGLPGAVPYFAAIDQLLRADLATSSTMVSLAYYNVVCASPLMLIMLIRSLLGAGSDAFFAALADWLARFAHRALVVLLLLLGAAMTIDTLAWLHGHPLVVLPPDGAARTQGQ